MANSPAPLQPTYHGHISSTLDALILFEACLNGQLAHVPRRPHDRERDSLIKSGNVFIYEEHSSGIKRWTDGYNWSPSRILGNFLIYRELEKAFPPGEKKRALKRKKSAGGVGKPNDSSSRSNSIALSSAGSTMGPDANMSAKDSERALIGSLVDSYPFKEGGLVKKTISVTWQGVPHHLVSYYKVEDVKAGRLIAPTKLPDDQMNFSFPRSDLINTQNFRVPIDQEDFGMDGPGLFQFPSMRNVPPTPGYGPPAGAPLPRTMSLPSVESGVSPYHQTQAGYMAQYPYSQGPMVSGSMMTTAGHYYAPPQGNYSYAPPRQRGQPAMGALQDYSFPVAETRRHSAHPNTIDHPTSMPLSMSPLQTMAEPRHESGDSLTASSVYLNHDSNATPAQTSIFDNTDLNSLHATLSRDASGLSLGSGDGVEDFVRDHWGTGIREGVQYYNSAALHSPWSSRNQQSAMNLKLE